MEFKLQLLNWTALFFAAYKGNAENVELLLSQKDIDINVISI